MADRPTFYVDRCLGKGVPQALRDAGASVEAHDDHFDPDSPDEEWIPQVAARGWVILTKDKNIRRPRGEREVVLTSGAKVITLSSGNMRGEEMARLLADNLSGLEGFSTTEPAPFVAIIDRAGKITRAYPAIPSAGDDASGERGS